MLALSKHSTKELLPGTSSPDTPSGLVNGPTAFPDPLILNLLVKCKYLAPPEEKTYKQLFTKILKILLRLSNKERAGTL